MSGPTLGVPLGDVVRIALVGCGRISRNHFEAIAKVDGLVLAAVCDVVEERARAAGDAQGVPWYTSYEALLAESACDAVAVCTPSGLHPPHGILGRLQRNRILREQHIRNVNDPGLEFGERHSLIHKPPLGSLLPVDRFARHRVIHRPTHVHERGRHLRRATAQALRACSKSRELEPNEAKRPEEAEFT